MVKYEYEYSTHIMPEEFDRLSKAKKNKKTHRCLDCPFLKFRKVIYTLLGDEIFHDFYWYCGAYVPKEFKIKEFKTDNGCVLSYKEKKKFLKFTKAILCRQQNKTDHLGELDCCDGQMVKLSNHVQKCLTKYNVQEVNLEYIFGRDITITNNQIKEEEVPWDD